MIPTVLDTEGPLFRPSLMAPPIACATTFHPADGVRLWLGPELEHCFERVLTQGPVLLQGGTHDTKCIAQWFPRLRPQLWRAYEEGRIWDTRSAQRIIEIQRGDQRTDLGLTMLGRLWGVDVPDKSDPEVAEIRMSFGQYVGATELPPAHAAYALGDAWAPFEIFQRQMASNLVSFRDLTELTRQEFWLSLVSARGFRTDLEHVRIFQARVEAHLELLDQLARESGFLRDDGSMNTQHVKCAVVKAYAGIDVGQQHPKTNERILPKAQEQALVSRILRAKECVAAARKNRWQISEEETALAAVPLSKSEKSIGTDKIVKADSGDEELTDLETWSQWRSTAAKDIEILLRGTVEPVHGRFGTANTYRSTMSDPNGQNWAKGKRPLNPGAVEAKHKVWGVRECIAPRSGLALVTTDAKGLENCSLAQCIIWATGRREFADKVNSGKDIHAELGADILGCSFEELQARRKAGDVEAEEARDCGKPGNFGLSGGMGRWQTLQGYARRGYNVHMSEERAKAVIAAFRRYAAADGRQAWIDRADFLKNELGRYDVPLCERLSDTVRRNVSRTDCCNNPFQFLGMRVMSHAGWKLLRGQYLTLDCPGFAIAFVHDDFTSEAKPEDVAEVAAYQERCIEEAGAELCPDVCWAGDSRALSHLSKGVKAVRVAGRLAVARVEV